jgi:hypothetical protein
MLSRRKWLKLKLLYRRVDARRAASRKSIIASILLQRFAYKWSISFTPLNPPLSRGETGNQVPSPCQGGRPEIKFPPLVKGGDRKSGSLPLTRGSHCVGRLCRLVRAASPTGEASGVRVRVGYFCTSLTCNLL